jgi:hypothetical protein
LKGKVRFIFFCCFIIYLFLFISITRCVLLLGTLGFGNLSHAFSCSQLSILCHSCFWSFETFD